jgi:hypothetical protein
MDYCVVSRLEIKQIQALLIKFGIELQSPHSKPEPTQIKLSVEGLESIFDRNLVTSPYMSNDLA